MDVSNYAKYPFGFGLSYHEAQYSELSLDKSQLSAEETLTVSLQIKNNSDFAGEETVQLYLRDLVGEVVRPIKELKGFQKVWLEPGGNQRSNFFNYGRYVALRPQQSGKHPVMLAHSKPWSAGSKQSRSADGYIQIRKIRIGRFI